MRLPWKHALRDLGVLAVCLAVWRLDASLRGQPGAGPGAVGLVAGALAAVCAFLAHEWGHLAGAVAGRSVWHAPAGVASLFLFHFDPDRNPPRAFVVMSLGGFAASGVVLALFAWVLPLEVLSGRVALGLAALGVLATAVLELPPFFRVLRGAPIPRGLGYKSAEPDGA